MAFRDKDTFSNKVKLHNTNVVILPFDRKAWDYFTFRSLAVQVIGIALGFEQIQSKVIDICKVTHYIQCICIDNNYVLKYKFQCCRFGFIPSVLETEFWLSDWLVQRLCRCTRKSVPLGRSFPRTWHSWPYRKILPWMSCYCMCIIL